MWDIILTSIISGGIVGLILLVVADYAIIPHTTNRAVNALTRRPLLKKLRGFVESEEGEQVGQELGEAVRDFIELMKKIKKEGMGGVMLGETRGENKENG